MCEYNGQYDPDFEPYNDEYRPDGQFDQYGQPFGQGGQFMPPGQPFGQGGQFIPPGQQFGQGGQFIPPGQPFGPGGQFMPPGFGQQGGMQPPGPPPNYIPQGPGLQAQVGIYAVDPGSIRPCRFRFVYIWLRNRRSFWAWLTFVGRRSVAGYRWTGFGWRYFAVDLNDIQYFECY